MLPPQMSSPTTINWRLPTVITHNNNGTHLASNPSRALTLAQKRTWEQRAATTHFEIYALDRAAGNVTATQFRQWINGTATAAITTRLNAITPTTVSASDALVIDNNIRATTWNYSAPIGILPSGTHLVFVVAVAEEFGVKSMVGRQQIRMR